MYPTKSVDNFKLEWKLCNMVNVFVSDRSSYYIKFELCLILLPQSLAKRIFFFQCVPAGETTRFTLTTKSSKVTPFLFLDLLYFVSFGRDF